MSYPHIGYEASCLFLEGRAEPSRHAPPCPTSADDAGDLRAPAPLPRTALCLPATLFRLQRSLQTRNAILLAVPKSSISSRPIRTRCDCTLFVWLATDLGMPSTWPFTMKSRRHSPVSSGSASRTSLSWTTFCTLSGVAVRRSRARCSHQLQLHHRSLAGCLHAGDPRQFGGLLGASRRRGRGPAPRRRRRVFLGPFSKHA
jgi:hypothetical protein